MNLLSTKLWLLALLASIILSSCPPLEAADEPSAKWALADISEIHQQGRPLTVRTRLDLSEVEDLKEVTGVWLAGLWTEEGKPLVALTWMRSKGPFPIWVIRLQSALGFQDPNARVNRGNDVFTEPEYIELKVEVPKPGRVYETVFCYHPDANEVAAQIVDLTDGRTLLTSSCLLKQHHGGPINAGAPGKGPATVELVEALPQFLPISATWQLMEQDDHGYLPIISDPISANQQVFVRAQLPVSRLEGRFTLVARDDDISQQLAVLEQTRDGVVIIPVRLPVGRYSLVLEYECKENVWASPKVEVNVVPARLVADISVDRFGSPLAGEVTLTADGRLAGVELELSATLLKAARNSWQPVSGKLPVLRQDLVLKAGQPVTLDFLLDLPPSSNSLYRIEFDASVSPENLDLLLQGKEQNIVLAKPKQDDRSYQFHGSITPEVLNNFLSRAITMTGFGNPEESGDLLENTRMLINVGAKFIGRAAYTWSAPPNDELHFQAARKAANAIHEIDPDVILQACIFEAVYEGINRIPIPEWVFAEFGLEPEERNFRYEDMLFETGLFKDHWSKNPSGSVPDMSRLETRMWFFYRAKRYIDAGYEALHLGQVHLMNANDPGYAYWQEIVGRIRDYAAEHARRRLVLLDAHTHGVVIDGRLMFDFHSFPLRIKEVPGKPQEGKLEVGYLDSVFTRSKGGITPSGWQTESLPYLVELDNYGSSDHPGQPGGKYWVWGYDEICWFAHQSEEYRNKWLRYAWDWVRENDPTGWLQMPGLRPLAVPVNGIRNYHANTASAAMPEGFNQEETIKDIWQEE